MFGALEERNTEYPLLLTVYVSHVTFGQTLRMCCITSEIATILHGTRVSHPWKRKRIFPTAEEGLVKLLVFPPDATTKNAGQTCHRQHTWKAGDHALEAGHMNSPNTWWSTYREPNLPLPLKNWQVWMSWGYFHLSKGLLIMRREHL